MKFNINNRDWEIKEISSAELLEKYKEYDSQAFYCFGMTKYDLQTIFLNNEMNYQVKKQTLYHELMHCYIWSYSSIHSEYGEEEICDLCANSHDIIHEIVKEYFKPTLKIDDVKVGACELEKFFKEKQQENYKVTFDSSKFC